MFDTGVELHSVVRGRPQQWQRVHWGIDRDDVEYHPYWKQKLVKTADDDILVSVWTRPGSALLQVFNLARTKKTVRLTLDAGKLHLGGSAKVYDLESGPAFASLKEQLRQYDAGTLEGEAEVRELQAACEKTGAEPYRLEDLRAVGAVSGIQTDVPPRDFVLLVAE